MAGEEQLYPSKSDKFLQKSRGERLNRKEFRKERFLRRIAEEAKLRNLLYFNQLSSELL